MSESNSSDNNDNDSVHSDNSNNYQINQPIIKKQNIMQRCESCLKYHNQDAYIHESEYNFGIAGIKTCVHCFIHFSLDKFIKRIGLTQKEKELLSDYIDIFVDLHNTDDCKIMDMFAQCLLCEKVDEYNQEKNERYNSDNKSELSDYSHASDTNVSDKLKIPDKLITSDLVVISNSDANDFVLIL
jgi:hypothetical protein